MKISKIFFIKASVFILFFLISLYYSPGKDFDLYRYYEFYDGIGTDQSILDFIVDVYESNFDFVYFLFFYVAKVNGLDKSVVNGFFVAFYYGAIILFIGAYVNNKKISRPRFPLLILLLPLFVSPLIYTLSISRTVASLSFFILSMYMYYEGKITFSVVCFIVALLTHVGMVVYILPVSLIVLMSGNVVWKLYHKFFYVVIFFLCLVSAYWIDPLINLVGMLSFFDKFNRYSTYLGGSTTIFNDLAYYDYLVAVCLLTVGFLLYLLITFHSKYTLAAGFVLLIFAATINYSTMFTQRTIMFLPPFLGVLLFEASKQVGVDVAKYLTKSVVFTVFLFFLVNLFGYRVILYRSFF